MGSRVACGWGHGGCCAVIRFVKEGSIPFADWVAVWVAV